MRAAIAVARALAGWGSAWHRPPRKAAFASGRVFVHPYLPGWPSPAFDRWVEHELERWTPTRQGPPALRAAILAVTRRCPLRCEHCLEWDELNRAEGLSGEELLEIAHQLRARGVAQVFLSGGEPLQRLDVVIALVTQLSGESDVWVLSSGMGLTRDRAARLRQAGLTGVALSLDHWEPAAHDRFRGRAGSFAAAERAAAHVREAGMVLALSLCPVRTFVTHQNLQRYARLARDLGAGFIHIHEPRALGHYAGRDVELEPADLRVLDEFAAWLNRHPDALRLPAAAHMGRLVRTTGCRGGREYIYIDTNGTVHPCPFCRGRGISLTGDGADRPIASLGAVGCPERDGRSQPGGLA